MTSNMQLVKLISGMEPVDFVGLARLLGVSVVRPVDEAAEYTSTAPDPQRKMEPRPFLDVLEDVVNKFNTLNRAKSRELLRLIKKANTENKKKGGKNAGNPPDSEDAAR